MVNYKYENLFAENSIKREIKIAFEGGSLGNDDLHNEEFTLTEGLCSENELRFGCCEASELKFRVTNAVGSLKNRKITVSSIMAGHTDDPFQFGKYTVESDAKSVDRRYRDITAYDQMHDVANAEVSAWYKGLSFPLPLLDLRNSFCQYMGIDQETVSLANDAMMVAETIKPSELSGKTVLEAICEINGCFGHFGRDGKLHYVHLKKMEKGLYPQTTLYPHNGLYPHGAKNVSKVSNSSYISCKYEDYICQSIDKLQIRQNENDIGAVSGTGNNCYVVENNFLVYGMSAEDLQYVANNLLPVISGVWYRPAQVVARANPCLEVGDGIILNTREADVYTYILERKLTGIQNIRDSYSAEGEEYRSKQVNGVMSDIKQLRGKTNELERNVEETRSEIKDVENNLSSQIKQTAGSIDLKVSKGDVSSQLSIESGQVKISGNRFVLDSTNFSISSDGKVTAKSIDITGGTINLQSASQDYSTIVLKYGSYTCGMDGAGVRATYSSSTTTLTASGIVTSGSVNAPQGYFDTINPKTSRGTIGFSSGVKINGDTELTTGHTHKINGTLLVDTTAFAVTSSGNVKLASSFGNVGFFGSNGATKKTVSKITSPSSTSTYSIATTLNSLIDALKAYNLIG